MKKLIIFFFVFAFTFSYSQNYTTYVIGKYSVNSSYNNGVYNCPSILELGASINYPYTVREMDSCFINHWTLAEPWDILVNADSSLIGCSVACGGGTAPIASVGKLYANDSIYLKVKQFGNQTVWRIFNGFKLYSTAIEDELSLPENALLLSPNPTSDVMYVQSTQQNFISSPVLYDIKGNKLDAEFEYINSHTYKLNVTNFSNGIYFVFVQSNKGYMKKKVVVTR